MNKKEIINEICNYENSPCLIFDEQGEFLFSNDKFTEYTGLNFQNILSVSSNFADFIDLKSDSLTIEELTKDSFFYLKRIFFNAKTNIKVSCGFRGNYISSLNCWKVIMDEIEMFEDYKSFNIEIFNPQTGLRKNLNSTLKKEDETQWQAFRKEILESFPENLFLNLRILKNNKVVFIQNLKSKEDLRNIEHFKTLTESMEQISFGYIDKNKKIRVEYRNGYFQLSGI